MAKLLKITKPDGTNHVVPLNNQNKSFWLNFNRKAKDVNKVTIDEITEKEAEVLPFKDPNHVTPGKAIERLGELEQENKDKDARIAELLKQLALANPPKPTAKELIEKIALAETVEAVNHLIVDTEFKTVKDAGAARIAELSK